MDENSVTIRLGDHELVLLPERAVYIPECRILLMSDLHIGKSNHFRKHGISVTRQVYTADLQQLNHLVNRFLVDEIIFLGDLFHSDDNQEAEEFLQAVSGFSARLKLVPGNHDRHSKRLLQQEVLAITDTVYNCEGLLLVHEWDGSMGDNPVISGHVHPAVKLKKGFTSITAPAFVVEGNHLMLPAFGKFTGNKIMEPSRKITFFPVTAGKVWDLR